MKITGAATSWFVAGAGIGGLVFPWAIGLWFGWSGAEAMPLATTLLAAATLAWFALVDRSFAARADVPAGSVPSGATGDRPG
jgi:hypothetical protein